MSSPASIEGFERDNRTFTRRGEAAARPEISRRATRSSTVGRLSALDVFRGLTVAAMIFVNSPGNWSHAWAPLTHSEWNGCTLADCIFPWFLFILGTAGVLSLERRRAGGASSRALAWQALGRGARIILVGWLIAAFPFTPERVANLRLPGVLPRIGLVFILGTWIVLVLGTPRRLPLAIVALLALHTYLLTGIGYDMTPEGNVQLAVDRFFLRGHMWPEAGDPEGIVSTLSAIASMLCGTMVGYLLVAGVEARTKTAWLVGGGALAIVLGELWSPLLPINKHLWTGSFVLLTSGAAALLLAACMWIDERRALARPLSMLVTFGRNPLAAFVLSELLNRALLIVHWRQASGRSISLRALLFTHGFAWVPHPTLASHLFAFSMVLLWYLVLRIFETRGWYWKL